MNYLLVNHVPFGRGTTPDTFEVGDMWLQDLRAEAAAIRSVGGKLTVATPLVDRWTSGMGGFRSAVVEPSAIGFDYVPLPWFNSLATYLNARRALKAQLQAVLKNVDIVQADSGGHPIALGQLVWPLAGHVGRRRIWAFDGADPIPRMELHANSERNAAKRLAKRLWVRRFERFCRSAVAEADLVFSHNASCVERFRAVWGTNCHLFDRSFVTDDILATDAEMRQRQERLRDANRPLRLVVAGRQIAIKATDHVLRAMATARGGGASLTLDVVGDGDDLPTYRALAQELGLGDVVRFHGSVAYGQPLFEIWSQADVMVITNLTAEISRNVLLSLARGLPLIMYRNPGTDALIEGGGVGILVPLSDVDALAGAFQRAASERKQLVDLATRGREFVKTRTLQACHQRRAELAVAALSRERTA